MNVAQLVALIAATLSMGLMAGVFLLYAHAVMPGLRETDDRTFVGAFRQIDIAIEQPRFLPVVAGAFVFTALAGALHVGAARSVVWWVAAALALYVAAMAITAGANVPRNRAIRAAGAPDCIPNLAAVRHAFDEPRWIAWNLLRALLTTASFGLLAWALVTRGRIDSAG